jgi:ABC-type nitrate/sulfonate/bicarbonate transport system ATPase subunit
MEPLVTIDGINYSHPQSEVCLFDNFSMALAAGKCHVFLGRSGCGKSTLLRLIAGLLKPESGCITIDSVNHKSGHKSDQKSGWKQFLFQDYDCFPWLNVSDKIGRAHV